MIAKNTSMENVLLPNLRKSTFWDTDFNALDYDRQANAIIKRVFEYGGWEEILEITDFYGEEKIKNALLNARSLRFGAIALASTILNIPKIDFYSFTNRPAYLP